MYYLKKPWETWRVALLLFGTTQCNTAQQFSHYLTVRYLKTVRGRLYFLLLNIFQSFHRGWKKATKQKTNSNKNHHNNQPHPKTKQERSQKSNICHLGNFLIMVRFSIWLIQKRGSELHLPQQADIKSSPQLFRTGRDFLLRFQSCTKIILESCGWSNVSSGTFLNSHTPSLRSCLWYQLFCLSGKSLCQNLNLDKELFS